MKDLLVVVPVLFAGGFALEGFSRSTARPEGPASGYLVFLAFLLVVLVVWYRSKLGSAERMKALEISRERPVPIAATVEAPGSSAVARLIEAPVGVAVFAWLTCLTTRCDPQFVWSMVGLIGVTAIGCVTLLEVRRTRPARVAEAPSDAPAAILKPHHDPDAYDLVARRG